MALPKRPLRSILKRRGSISTAVQALLDLIAVMGLAFLLIRQQIGGLTAEYSVLLLLLGMGVDYGIFLLEHPGDGSAWVAVALAGVSTLLSFGLLGLSATPALRAFGLTMLIGEVSIWILTPFFRPPLPPRNPTTIDHARQIE